MADYRQILDSLSTSIFLLDGNFTIVYLNESAETLIQTSRNRARGLPLKSFIREGQELPQSNGFYAACRKSLDENLRVWLRDEEIEIPNILQFRQVDCRIFNLLIDSSSMVLLEILPHDSDHIRQASVDRMSVNHTVIRKLAHEIRNPLGGMRGAAQLLSNELLEILPDKQHSRALTEYTDIIIREADRLTSLVGQMQASTFVEEKNAINIHCILEKVRKLLASDGLTGATISTDYDPSLPEILGDSNQLTQAFINIVRNAIESVVTVEADGLIVLKSRIDHQILPGSDQQQQVVRVDIFDNGEGIDKELLDHIFDPMVTGKSMGTGLGLSITSEIIRNHGGVISVQSEAGRTVFSTYLKTWEAEIE